jgi:hypothetical protein
MAVALGHSTAETVHQKRTYLLFDQDIIQVFAVDGIAIKQEYAIQGALHVLKDIKSFFSGTRNTQKS